MAKHNREWAQKSGWNVSTHMDVALSKLEELQEYAEELSDDSNVELLVRVMEQLEDAHTEFGGWMYPTKDGE